MAGFAKTVLTTKGRNLLARAQTGTPLVFTKAKLGSGQLASGQTLETLTQLVSPVMDVAIQGISVTGEGRSRLRISFSNAGLAEGFYLRELGLYANDPYEGEILYAATNADTKPDYLPAYGGSVIVEQVIDIITVIGNAANVTAVIDGSATLATIQDLGEHRTLNPIDHPDDSVTDAKIGDRTIVDTVAATAGAGKVTNLFSKIGYMIKAITGKQNWYTLPAMSLEAANNHANATDNIHGATSTNTANKVVIRDGNGDFAARIITAALAGNSTTATRLQTPRTINGIGFDGTANISIPTFPSGGIIMWSGSIASIPGGWALCNGQNGTPNLMDRFIVGAGSSYGVGATGGEAYHALTVEELPPHSHALNVMGGTDRDSPGNVANEFQTGPDGLKGWKYTQNTGSGWGHENRPPYYALAYIMKL